MELKSIGVKLAIDDFGTGYSSLSYLRELPFDVVKMDKSFVDGIADSEQRLALAEGIVQIARTLRLEVVAEGIESEIQRDLLDRDGLSLRAGLSAGDADAAERGRGSRPPWVSAHVPSPDAPRLTLTGHAGGRRRPHQLP